MNGMGGTGNLPPELVAQLMGLSTGEDEARSLEQQLEMARALRMGKQQPHSTGLGAALGGLGDIASKIASYTQEKGLLGKQKELLDRQNAARKAGADEYFRRGSQANLVGQPGVPVGFVKDPNGYPVT